MGAHLSGVQLKPIQWVVLAFYIVATILETIFATTAIFCYEGDYSQHGSWEENFVYNKWLMQAIDYCWFFSLPFASHFQPPSPDIRITTVLAEDEEIPEVTYGEVSTDPAYDQGVPAGAYEDTAAMSGFRH